VWFSVVAFKFLQDDYGGSCNTLMQCWRVTFDQGFKNDGGIGGFMTDLSFETDNEWHVVGRFLYDNLFFICLLVLLLNILFGVIIDTFAVLRDSAAQRQNDMMNMCTICSIECSEFDRKTTMGHEYHIKAEHNMWEYCALLWHLKLKTDTEYTGLESYLHGCCEAGDLRFFPIHRAMSLKGGALWHSDADDQHDTESSGGGGSNGMACEVADLKAQVLESNQQVAKVLQLLEQQASVQLPRKLNDSQTPRITDESSYSFQAPELDNEYPLIRKAESFSFPREEYVGKPPQPPQHPQVRRSLSDIRFVDPVAELPAVVKPSPPNNPPPAEIDFLGIDLPSPEIHAADAEEAAAPESSASS